MLAINYTVLRDNMKKCLDQITEGCETLLIMRTTDRENVVALSEDSYETLQENLYLLESFSNQQRLEESIRQLAQGLSLVQSLPGVDRLVIFSENAWQDYTFWQAEDEKILKKIDAILTDIATGTGGSFVRPRPLQGDLRGFWSRRINDHERLIYRVDQEGIHVLACRCR